MEPNLSNYMQNQIRQAKQLEAQLEQLAAQRYQIEARVKEIEKTLKELESVNQETPVYKSVGNIIYRVEDRKKLIDDLSEQKELSEIRLKTLDRQQKALEDKYKELEASIQQRYEEETKRRGSVS